MTNLIHIAAFCFCTHTSSLDTNAIADAIWHIEGGKKAKVEYGILSVKTNNPRRVCLNTIVNNHKRWIVAGRPGCYLDFLADRYCPSSSDPVGNKRWKRNIHLCLIKNGVK